jgi:hypothetical protein
MRPATNRILAHTIVLTVIMTGAVTGIKSQEKKDDPLDQAAFLTGEWSGTLELTIPGGKAKADATGKASRVYAGNYIRTEYVYDVPGPLVIEGTEYLTYDAGRKKFRSFAFQNTGRAPYVSEGELVDGALVMTTQADGQPNHVPMRATMKPAGADGISYRMERKQGDGWALLGEGTFKKKPKTALPASPTK